MTALVSDTVIAGAPDDCQLLEPLDCAELGLTSTLSRTRVSTCVGSYSKRPAS